VSRGGQPDREQTGKEVGMRPGLKTVLGATVVVFGLMSASATRQASYGDEPSTLGRFFRFGRNSSAPTPNSPPPAQASPTSEPAAFPYSDVGAGSTAAPTAASPRLVPQPRVSRPATEADPILTRITLTRSSDGKQFGMALQIYADGTVIDSEGVHRVGPRDLKPVTDALAMTELYRLKGHCGSPATDYIEQVYIVVYERNLGRLRANAFSYSGNPQGCEHAVRHLHTALETLQMKLAQPAAPVANGALTPGPFTTPRPSSARTVGTTISLTPIE
jgi:hypothetical protein